MLFDLGGCRRLQGRRQTSTKERERQQRTLPTGAMATTIFRGETANIECREVHQRLPAIPGTEWAFVKGRMTSLGGLLHGIPTQGMGTAECHGVTLAGKQVGLIIMGGQNY